jgi:ABC-type glycerol-3-phosphate transport system permease component
MKRFNTSKNRKQILLHLILLPFALITVYPIFWTLSSSFKFDYEIFQNIWGLPSRLRFENYLNVWETARLGRAFFNSFYISIFTVLFVVVISILASYAFAREKSRVMKGIYISFIAAMMVPPDVLFLTIFFQVRDLGLINSLWGVIFPSVSLGLPLSIFILTNYIKDLPQSLFDSAKMDGCSRFRRLISIALPLIKAPLGAVIVFQFTGIWNSFILPLIILRRTELRVLPQALNSFIGQFTVRYTEMFAAIILTFIPVLLIFIFFQRSFMQGMTQGAVKE